MLASGHVFHVPECASGSRAPIMALSCSMARCTTRVPIGAQSGQSSCRMQAPWAGASTVFPHHAQALHAGSSPAGAGPPRSSLLPRWKCAAASNHRRACSSVQHAKLAPFGVRDAETLGGAHSGVHSAIAA
jgi:hypothetical protein